MIKFVYILISGENDFLTEQAFLSMHSLKKHNPNAFITLVSDKETLESLTGGRERIKEYVNEYITKDLPSELTPVQKNRFLKTSLRKIVKGDFLYLDNDTIIIDKLDELNHLECEFGAVLDHNSPVINHNGQVKLYLKKTGKQFWNYNKYFNGGILFAKDTPKTSKLFEDWHKLWNEERVKFGLSFDQPSFAQSNVANGCLIEELDGAYNCQMTQKEAVPYLFNAKIIHYYASSDSAAFFPLTKPEVLLKIRQNGVTEEIEKIINCPQVAYLENSIILGGENLVFYLSPIVSLGKVISVKIKYSQAIARRIYKLLQALKIC